MTAATLPSAHHRRSSLCTASVGEEDTSRRLVASMATNRGSCPPVSSPPLLVARLRGSACGAVCEDDVENGCTRKNQAYNTVYREKRQIDVAVVVRPHKQVLHEE